jgi:hypothetical protein
LAACTIVTGALPEPQGGYRQNGWGLPLTGPWQVSSQTLRFSVMPSRADGSRPSY